MVTLEPVSAENRPVLNSLSVRDDQRRFLDCSSVAHVLTQFQDHPAFRPYAIRAGNSVAGLVIYGGLSDDPSRAWISLLLVDEEHQGRGYGRAAVSAIIREQHRRMPPSRELGLSYRPGNRTAENLYASLGFRATGVDDRGNVVAWLTLARD